MKEKIISFIESIKSNNKIDSFDEASTKQAIVLKLLSILGWDTFDVDEVMPEYSVKSTRVDYSLRIDEKNKAFIEVKKTHEDLEKHQKQLLNYSFEEGIELSALTNGMTWWFYLPLNKGSWEQRKFYSIDLLQQNPENIALKFIDFLSKDNIATGKSLKTAKAELKSQQKENILKDALPKAWNKIISDPDELFVDLISETTEKICGYQADTDLVEKFLLTNKDNWLIAGTPAPIKKKKTVPNSKTHISKTGKYAGKSISSFSFRGKTYEVRYWIELLTTLCKILVSEKNKDFDKVLQLVGRKRPYFTHNPNELRNNQKIEGTNIFVETNLSSDQIVKISHNMIALFGYTKNDLRINVP